MTPQSSCKFNGHGFNDDGVCIYCHEDDGSQTKASDEPTNPQPVDEGRDYSSLARAPMKKMRIAFDVDGTLRCNCTETCTDPNRDIVELFRILNKFKNTELYVWSGGGADYALRFAREFQLGVKETNCLSKFNAPKMDIAIDDIQETALGAINLIVREK